MAYNEDILSFATPESIAGIDTSGTIPQESESIGIRITLDINQ